MSGYVESLCVLVAINTIFAYSAYVSISVGQLNLGLAGFAAIGAYASATLSNDLILSPISSVLVGGLVAGSIALVVALPVLRTRGIYLALATFAVGQIVKAIILNLEYLGGASGLPVNLYLGVLPIVVISVCVAISIVVLFRTRFGLNIRAVEADDRVADLIGIPVVAVQASAFTIGAALAGIGGGLYAHHFSYIEAQSFNVNLSISIVLYAILGGTQTALGPIVGAVIFTLLPEVLRVNANWRYVIFAIVIVLLMAIRPNGLITRSTLNRCRTVFERRRLREPAAESAA